MRGIQIRFRKPTHNEKWVRIQKVDPGITAFVRDGSVVIKNEGTKPIYILEGKQ